MSSTNKTPNYNLSQFTADDKPAWLGDYNSDMQKIDTQMKANATKADSAESTANNANQTASDALEASTEAKTLASGASTNASTALSTAQSANTKAEESATKSQNAMDIASSASGNASSALSMAQNANTNANKALNGLDKLNLKNSMLFNDSTGNIVNGQNCGSDFGNSGLTLAYDDTNSIFKLYGILRINNPDNGGLNRTVKLLNTPLRPTKDITLVCCGLTAYGQNLEKVDQCNITVKTDGTIELTTWFNVDNSAKEVRVFFWNSLYLLQAFEQSEVTPGQ